MRSSKRGQTTDETISRETAVNTHKLTERPESSSLEAQSLPGLVNEHTIKFTGYQFSIEISINRLGDVALNSALIG